MARIIEGHRAIARQIAKDRIGTAPLSKVGVKTFDDYYVRLKARGLSPATIPRDYALMRAAFRQAMAWDWVTRNPVQPMAPSSRR